MIEKTALRLMIGFGLPMASALVLEQLPKSGVAQVPFAFQVENQTLPPGAYAVKQWDRGQRVHIQSEKKSGLALTCAAVKHTFGKPQGARLVFENYDGHYVLSEIWFEADGRGLILRPSSLEKNTSDGREPIRSVRFQ
jgi:hypothetical protein